VISVISCVLLRHNHRGEEAGQEPDCTISQVALQIKSSITSKDEDHGSPRVVLNHFYPFGYPLFV